MEQYHLEEMQKKAKSLSRRTLSISPNKVSFRRKLAFSSAMMGGAALGRVALQGIPSVEPIIAMAVITGYLLGWRHGAYVGASAFFASNFFVFGFHGPWTIAQVAGAAMAGAAPAIIGRLTKSRYGFLASLGAGTLLFELAVNTGTAWFWMFGPMALITAAPFGAIHLASTLSFGGAFWAVKDRVNKLNLEDKYELKVRDTRYNINNSGNLRLIFTELTRTYAEKPCGLVRTGSEWRIWGKEYPNDKCPINC